VLAYAMLSGRRACPIPTVSAARSGADPDNDTLLYCAAAKQDAQQASCLLHVGALLGLVPHQDAYGPRLQAIGQRADFVDGQSQGRLCASHDEGPSRGG
jgi:hypothetical protein